MVRRNNVIHALYYKCRLATMAAEKKESYAHQHTNAAKDNLSLPIFYCINLEKSTQRRIGMEARFKLLGAKHVMVNAVTNDCSLIKFYSKDYNHPNHSNSPLVPNNTACTASHFKAIRTFLETEDKEAFICEDDIVFRKDFWALYDSARQNMPEECPLVTFSYMITRWVDENKKSLTAWTGKDPKMKNLSTINPEHTWGGQLYWISREYAIQVLATYDKPWYMPNWMGLNEMFIRDSKGCLHLPPLAIEEDIVSDRCIHDVDRPYHRKHFEAWGLQNYVHE